ncbi:MAG: hypothetical protein FWD94_01165 [Treponema sp.]|nr:hypothetical protein [Treponema sp.]
MDVVEIKTLEISGERYALASSLAEALGVAAENREDRIKWWIERYGLKRGTGWMPSHEGILFTPTAALRISDDFHRRNTKFVGHTRETAVRRDADGLPILRPAKRRGPPINPYDLDG